MRRGLSYARYSIAVYAPLSYAYARALCPCPLAARVPAYTLSFDPARIESGSSNRLLWRLCVTF